VSPQETRPSQTRTRFQTPDGFLIHGLFVTRKTPLVIHDLSFLMKRLLVFPKPDCSEEIARERPFRQSLAVIT